MGHFLSSHLFAAPWRAPFFLRLLFGGWLLLAGAGLRAAEDVVVIPLPGSDFAAAREALVEAVEAEGLVVSARIPFNRMLARTAEAVGQAATPYGEAEIVQFCSSGLAWQMVGEDAGQLALCPLSIAVYTPVAEPGRVFLAYRRAGAASAARQRADALLHRLAVRTGELARLRW